MDAINGQTAPTLTDAQAQCYIDRYPDTAYGSDLTLAKAHYQSTGFFANKNPYCSDPYTDNLCDKGFYCRSGNWDPRPIPTDPA
jgi:hypothetical protein